jgi:organic hydroperoxide reductase OsmC/OhrA
LILIIVKLATPLEFVGVGYLLAVATTAQQGAKRGRAITEALLNAADQIRPYSNATRGNISVSTHSVKVACIRYLDNP